MEYATLKSLFRIRGDSPFAAGVPDPGTAFASTHLTPLPCSEHIANLNDHNACPALDSDQLADLDASLPYLIIPGASATVPIPGTCSKAPHSSDPTQTLVITRREMHALSCSLAGLLCASGAVPHVGDRVALVLPNTPQFVACLYSITFARAVCVPLNPAFTRDELQYYLTVNRVRLAIVAANTSSKSTVLTVCQPLGISVWSVAMDGAQGPCSDTFSVEPVAGQDTRERACTPFSSTPACLSLSGGHLARGDQGMMLRVTWEQGPVVVPDLTSRAARAALSLRPPPQGDDVAIILHTSGTTGPPKRVPLRHRQLVWRAVVAARRYQLGARDVCLMVAPLFHVLGLGLGLFTPLASGGAVVLPPRFDPASVFSTVVAEQVTWIPAAPTVHRALLAEAHAHPDKLWPRGQVRSLITGGAPLLRRELASLERTLGVCVVSIYGLSETSSVAATRYHPPLSPPQERNTDGDGRQNKHVGGEDNGTPASHRGRADQGKAGSGDTGRGGMPPSSATDDGEDEVADGDAPTVVGVTFDGLQLALMDDAGNHVVGDAQHPGEVCVRGPGIFDGYEDATEEMDADSWHPAHAGQGGPVGDGAAGGDGKHDRANHVGSNNGGAGTVAGRVAILASGARPGDHAGAVAPSSGHEDDDDNSVYTRLRWFRTGDLAYFDARRELVICGRRSDLINRGAMKVQPAEVERVLKRHPGVADAAVFPMPDALYGQVVAACVVLADASMAGGVSAHAPATHKELLAHCTAHLAAYKLPGSFFVAPSLPTNAAGKVPRARLVQMATAGELARLPWDANGATAGGGGEEPPVAPRTPLERRVAAIWQRALGVARVSVVDHFVHMGGHSLNAARLMQQMRDADPLLAAALMAAQGGARGHDGDASSPLLELSTVETMARAAERALAGQGSAGMASVGTGSPADTGWSAAPTMAVGDDGRQTAEELSCMQPQSGGGQCAVQRGNKVNGEEEDVRARGDATWRRADVSRALASTQVLWSYAVVAAHFGHCGGQNLRCFQSTSLGGVWAPFDNSLANFVPKMVPGCLQGLALASGLGLAASRDGVQLQEVLFLPLLALLMQYGICNQFDALVVPPGERFSTTAHLWGLWALVVNHLLAYAFAGTGVRHLARAHARRWPLLGCALAIHFALPAMLAVFAPPEHVMHMRGMWVGPWGMHQPGWHPLGPRVFTVALPFVLGYLFERPLLRMVVWARGHGWVQALSLAAYVQLGYMGACFVRQPGTSLLDLRDVATTGKYASLADVMAAGDWGWASQLASHAQNTLLSLPLLLLPLMFMPARRGLLPWLSDMPLPSFLLHPLLLRLVEPHAFWLLRQTARQLPLALIIIVLVPFLCQVIITVVFHWLQRRNIPMGFALVSLAAALASIRLILALVR